MHDLTTALGGSTPLTMTSREIADLTGKEHRNVMADIRKMLAKLHGEDRVLSFQQTVERLNPSGGAPIPAPMFMLPKRETLILVSGYTVTMCARINDRWQELEAAPPQALNPAALSRMQLIELAMQAEQERLALEHEFKELAPKAAALYRIAVVGGAAFIALDLSDVLAYLGTLDGSPPPGPHPHPDRAATGRKRPSAGKGGRA